MPLYTQSYSVKEQLDDGDYHIVYKLRAKRFIFFGEWQELVKGYLGSGTVWHEIPSGKRCATNLEYKLCDVSQQYLTDKRRKDILKRMEMIDE